MSHIPERDVSDHCEGECRDRVHEGEDERQQQNSLRPTEYQKKLQRI